MTRLRRTARHATNLVTMACLSSAAALASPPMVVAGGTLDPAFAGADVFIADPRTATAPNGPGCATASRYVDLVNAGDFPAVAALYAEDATFLEPMRPTLQGRAQITDFYVHRMGAMKPRIAAVSYLGTGRECMVSLALRTEIGGRQRYVLASVDHFLVRDDGRIVSMVTYARPPRASSQP